MNYVIHINDNDILDILNGHYDVLPEFDLSDDDYAELDFDA